MFMVDAVTVAGLGGIAASSPSGVAGAERLELPTSGFGDPAL
jgi:hypothetical protein